MHTNATTRRDLLRRTRRATLAQALAQVGITLPPDNHPCRARGPQGPSFFWTRHYRRHYPSSHSDQAPHYRLLSSGCEGKHLATTDQTKILVPAVLNEVCKGYEHVEELQKIVHNGVEIRLSKAPPRQSQRPPNHGSARDRLNVLRKKICKEQDAGRCLDVNVSGRTIDDLSYPEGTSINDCTDQGSIIKPEHTHCDAVATEILKVKRDYPGAWVRVMAGDVAASFRNISIHRNSVYLFAGHIEEDGIIVIELASPLGWTPGFYEIAGGSIAYVHGSHTTKQFPGSFFNYHWVDDHINVVADVGSACDSANRSLRYAMVAKKIIKAQGIVATAFYASIAIKEGLPIAHGQPTARGNLHPGCASVSSATSPAGEPSSSLSACAYYIRHAARFALVVACTTHTVSEWGAAGAL
ncbi:unnamed protein product [Phytophthora fragariaefolia]|uniref:Unnamed protein product n=1 Tax=Phytophthora fragariaefolia TaxID=1490495 RepID=A0A9W6XZL8_9STRA|nr:unnamed protein product [Phytophthora fragariaefolia]